MDRLMRRHFDPPRCFPKGSKVLSLGCLAFLRSSGSKAGATLMTREGIGWLAVDRRWAVDYSGLVDSG